MARKRRSAKSAQQLAKDVKSSSVNAEGITQTSKAVVIEGGVGRQEKRVSSKARKEVDIDKWLESHVDELTSLLGLDLLKLKKEEYIEILRKPVELLYGSPSSRPDALTIAKRIKRYSEDVYPAIALTLLNLRDELTLEQVDFIVNNIGKAVLNVASRLYKEVIKFGRDDLLSLLRRVWRVSWLENRSKTLPLECPVCRFNALMPDLTCLVCGSTVSERQVKEFINFKESLKSFVSSLSCEDIKNLLKYDYVLINGISIKHPTLPRDVNIDVELYLDKDEKTLIKTIYESLCKGGFS